MEQQVRCLEIGQFCLKSTNGLSPHGKGLAENLWEGLGEGEALPKILPTNVFSDRHI